MKTPALIILAGMVSTASAHAAKFVELDSRPGVKQAYLFLHDDDVDYKAAAILFAGDGGEVGLRPDGTLAHGGNFLVRSRRLFVDAGVAVAVIDTPSDMKGGMHNIFRKNDKHMADVAAVVADLKTRLPGAKVYLIGTSQGSVSAAFAGAKLSDRLGGIVLTSSVFGDGGAHGAGLNGFDFSKIKTPILIVHNTGDDCNSAPYNKAAKLGRTYPLISVTGVKGSQTDPCGAHSAHGYLGFEKETVDAIADWILGRPYPREIK